VQLDGDNAATLDEDTVFVIFKEHIVDEPTSRDIPASAELRPIIVPADILTGLGQWEVDVNGPPLTCVFLRYRKEVLAVLVECLADLGRD
jgi:hypothetical protein